MLRFLPGPGEKTASPLSDQAISSTRSGTQEAGDRGAHLALEVERVARARGGRQAKQAGDRGAVEWKTGGGGGGARPVGSVRRTR